MDSLDRNVWNEAAIRRLWGIWWLKLRRCQRFAPRRDPSNAGKRSRYSMPRALRPVRTNLGSKPLQSLTRSPILRKDWFRQNILRLQNKASLYPSRKTRRRHCSGTRGRRRSRWRSRSTCIRGYYSKARSKGGSDSWWRWWHRGDRHRCSLWNRRHWKEVGRAKERSSSSDRWVRRRFIIWFVLIIII